MQQIFDFFKSIINIVVGFVQGIFNLGQTIGQSQEILSDWMVYVPSTVAWYILTGVMVTIVLVILGRANK